MSPLNPICCGVAGNFEIGSARISITQWSNMISSADTTQNMVEIEACAEAEIWNSIRSRFAILLLLFPGGEIM